MVGSSSGLIWSVAAALTGVNLCFLLCNKSDPDFQDDIIMIMNECEVDRKARKTTNVDSKNTQILFHCILPLSGYCTSRIYIFILSSGLCKFQRW